LERPVLTFFLDRRVAILASRITKGEEMTWFYGALELSY
jgi:hypothetical protein